MFGVLGSGLAACRPVNYVYVCAVLFGIRPFQKPLICSGIQVLDFRVPHKKRVESAQGLGGVAKLFFRRTPDVGIAELVESALRLLEAHDPRRFR